MLHSIVYHASVDYMLGLNLAPYMVDERFSTLRNLYHKGGVLRFMCLLKANVRSNLDYETTLLHLFVFDLQFSINPKKVIETIWPVSPKNLAGWESYSECIRNGEDPWLNKSEYELAHHMIKKYKTECANAWTFIVRMDMSNKERVGYFGRNNQLINATSVTIFGDITLDKLLLSRIPLSGIMALAATSTENRFRIWVFLWKHPFDHYDDDEQGNIYLCW